jgi:acetyl-CoA carboxylase biotin carboxylase subunit
MVKASAGGGGRGIRLVNTPEELEPQVVAAKQEALNFFGDDSIYMENS